MVSGEAAAFATSISWAATALFFAAAARRVGSPLVNVVRLAFAAVLLGGTVLLTGAASRPPSGQLAALALSGVIGFALGDAAYFRALEYLGPRRASLFMALAPVFTALLMVPLLGESLGGYDVLGMAVTIAGIAWVDAERVSGGEEPHPHAGRGVLFGVLGSVGQAAGLVLTKVGLGVAPADSFLASLAGLAPRVAEDGSRVAGEAVAPLFGTLLRVVVGLAWLAAGAAVLRRPPKLGDMARDRRALLQTVGGTVFGPYLGVWMSLYAVSHANTAVASTILATSPVFVIPMVLVVHGERASWRAWVGALVAVGGVAVLTLV